MVDRYEQLRSFYAEFAHHRQDARRVAWRSYDDQILRMEVLLEALAPEDYPVSVLDVGCGTGTLYGFLRDTDRLGKYLGIDLLPEMVEQAQAAFPEGRFRAVDLVELESRETFDLVICSGTLNVHVRNHDDWVQRMLAAMWNRANRAVLVNFQWTRAYKTNPISRFDEDIVHVDRSVVLGWCERLTPWVTLRQDYLSDDLTVYLYKEYHRTVSRMRRERRHDPRTAAEQACGLAHLLLERKLPKLALELLESVEPTAAVLNYRGLSHHRLGDDRKARKYYERALSIDPTLEEARLNLDWIIKK